MATIRARAAASCRGRGGWLRLGKNSARAPASGEIGHRLAGGDRAVDEEGLVAVRVEAPAAQQRRLLCGPAEVHPGDDPEDANAAQAGAPATQAATCVRVAASMPAITSSIASSTERRGLQPISASIAEQSGRRFPSSSKPPEYASS